MPITFEIVRGLSYEQYAEAPGLNAGVLVTACLENLEVAKALIDGQIKRESDSLDFGKVYHSLLEGKSDFAVHPETYPAPADHQKVKKGELKEGDPLPWNWNANSCKAWAKHARDMEGAKEIVSPDQFATAEKMIAKIRENEQLSSYLSDAAFEVCVFVEKDGIKFKIRVDCLPQNEAFPVLDWKSCRSAEPEAFTRSLLSLGYHIRAAFYLDVLRWAGINRRTFTIVAQEKDHPYTIGIVPLEDEEFSFLRVGRRRYRAALQKIINARNSNVWPGYGTFFPEQYAPAYALKELEMVG